jgi:hypothetical protein
LYANATDFNIFKRTALKYIKIVKKIVYSFVFIYIIKMNIINENVTYKVFDPG